MRVTDNINIEITSLNIVTGIGWDRTTVLATMVKERLQESRSAISSAARAVLVGRTKRPCASYLLAGVVVAVSRLNTVDDFLEAH